MAKPDPGVQLPFPEIAPDTDADPTQVTANDAALKGKFGNIVDEDLHGEGDFDGNKFSATAGKRVPETRLENAAVSLRTVQADATIPGNDSGRAIDGSAIRTLTAAQIARFLPLLSLDRLRVILNPVSLAGVVVTTPGTGGSPTFRNPTATFPKATYDLIGVFVKNPVATVGSVLHVSAWGDDTGTNWTGVVSVIGSSNTTLASGSVVYVFASKVTV